MPRLTPKQACFVEEYLLDFNATQAAIRAGYSARRASEIGYSLLQKNTVQSAIEVAQRERSARTGVTADRVVQEIARLAFSSLSDVMTWGPDGAQVRRDDEITPDAVAAIAEITETRNGVKVKLHNKVSALEQLAKHVGLYNDRAAPAAVDAVIFYLPDNGR
jgi:phage terminase small subunit